jgi:hypothetical protein
LGPDHRKEPFSISGPGVPFSFKGFAALAIPCKGVRIDDRTENSTFQAIDFRLHVKRFNYGA